MIRTGWTHDAYDAAPDALIDQMVILLNAQASADVALSKRK